MNIYRQGIWLIKEEKFNIAEESKLGEAYQHTVFKATLLEEINENPIKAFPFVNVEKYRNEIELALIETFEKNTTLSVEKCTTNIIKKISEKILKEKAEQIVLKEDFL